MPEHLPRACSLLIRNGVVVTMNDAGTIYPAGAVAVDGTDIIDVGADSDLADRYRPREVVDARGAIVHPGIVDAHYHVTMHTTRGVIDNLPPAAGGDARAGFGIFSRWFEQADSDDEYASALLACLEMVKNGVTCFVDPGTVFDTDAVAEAARRVGVRGSLADPFLWDVEGGLKMASEITRAPAKSARALKLLGRELRRNDDRDGLVLAHVSLYGSGSASEQLLRAAKECADAAGVAFCQHQSLDKNDAAFDRRRFGEEPLAHFSRIGVLGPNCSFMHMNALTAKELDAVERAQMNVIWHPGNFLFYGIGAGGHSPAPELIRRGVSVALGADIAKAWTFTETAFLGFLVGRMQGVDLAPEMMLRLLTRNGARAAGLLDRLGSIDVGKRADIVVRHDELPEAQPNFDPMRQLMLVSRTKSVRSVIVGGKSVVKDGAVQTVDEHEVFSAAQASAARMAARLGLASARRP